MRTSTPATPTPAASRSTPPASTSPPTSPASRPSSASARGDRHGLPSGTSTTLTTPPVRCSRSQQVATQRHPASDHPSVAVVSGARLRPVGTALRGPADANQLLRDRSRSMAISLQRGFPAAWPSPTRPLWHDPLRATCSSPAREDISRVHGYEGANPTVTSVLRNQPASTGSPSPPTELCTARRRRTTSCASMARTRRSRRRSRLSPRCRRPTVSAS